MPEIILEDPPLRRRHLLSRRELLQADISKFLVHGFLPDRQIVVTFRFEVAEVSWVSLRFKYQVLLPGVISVRHDDVGIHSELMQFTDQPLEESLFEFTAPSPAVGPFEVQFSSLYPLTFSWTHVFVHATGPCGRCPVQGGCIHCDETDIPGNATVVPLVRGESTGCEWICLPEFREREGSCEYCPVTGCPAGEYEADCLTCVPCEGTRLPDGYRGKVRFTGQGQSRFLDSCPYECADGFFEVLPLGCFPCSEVACADGEYLEECTAQSDARCRPCLSTCPPGTEQVEPCSATRDTRCEECPDNPPSGAAWTTGCSWECRREGLLASEFILNTDEQICQLCLPRCDVGFFQTACLAENSWTGCEPCVLPAGAAAVSAGTETENSCLWVCSDPTVPVRDSSGVVRCEAAGAVEPPPEQCVATCDPGRRLDVTSCSCVPCAPDKPEGAVWLSTFLTSLECQWTCLPPLAADRQNGLCIAVGSLFPAPGDPGPAPPARREAARPDPLLEASAFGPVILISLLVGCLAVCSRSVGPLRRRAKSLSIKARQLRQRAAAALARIRS